MTVVAWVCLAVAVIAAVANWWSRWREHRPTELWSKPLALVALIGMAVALDPADPTVRAWFVAALVASLAGDVFLLGGDRSFVPGLLAFLVGHLLYVAGFLSGDEWRWSTGALGLAAVAALAATAGRRIVVGAGRHRLRAPVAAYLLVISAMAVVAAAAGNALAVAGAFLFVGSDSVLGWRQFVGSRPWMAPVIMITYHLAQAALVLSLR